MQPCGEMTCWLLLARQKVGKLCGAAGWGYPSAMPEVQCGLLILAGTNGLAAEDIRYCMHFSVLAV